MTDHRTIAETETDALAPLRSALFKALQKNAIAMAEGSTTGDGLTPVNRAFWHPYNKLLLGDANTGVIFDHATDGNTLSFETPDLVDGYDYRVIGKNLDRDNLTLSISVEWYRSEDDGYSAPIEIALGAGGLDFDYEFLSLRSARRGGSAKGEYSVQGAPTESYVSFTDSTEQKTTKLRFTGSSQLVVGQVFLHRRRTVVP